MEPGDLDIPLGCIVRTFPGSLTREQVRVDSLAQLEGTLTLEDHEELVSHIITISTEHTTQVRWKAMATWYNQLLFNRWLKMAHNMRHWQVEDEEEKQTR